MRMFCKSSTVRIQRAAIAGFSLVEVMMAALIGAVIFIALFSGMTQGFNIVQHQRNGLRATEIIVNKIEGIRLCAWGSTATNSQLFNTAIIPTTFTDYFYPLGLGSFPASNVVYNGTINIQGTNFTFYDFNGTNTTAPTYRTNMAQVVVMVT